MRLCSVMRSINNVWFFVGLDNYTMVQAADALNCFVNQQLFNINLCTECYVNFEPNRIELPCKVPHLLIWAKSTNYPPWPAKLMRFNKHNNSIDVQYFGGDHLQAVLLATDCVLYSRQNPSVSFDPYRQALEIAQKVCYLISCNYFNSMSLLRIGEYLMNLFSCLIFVLNTTFQIACYRRLGITFKTSSKPLAHLTMRSRIRLSSETCSKDTSMTWFRMRGIGWASWTFHHRFQNRFQHRRYFQLTIASPPIFRRYVVALSIHQQ